MKVAINTLPLRSGHKDRGIGYYTHNLLEALKLDDSIEVIEFSNLSEVNNVDLVHYPWFDLYFHTLPLRKPYPTVVTLHDVIPLIFPNYYPVGFKGQFNLALQKLALGGCKRIITDSNTSKKDIVKVLKIDEEKISVVPLAVSDDFRILPDTKILQIKRKYKLPDQFLLYVGDANWVKNLPFLVEGFSRIIQRSGLEQVKLILAGGVFLKKVENINHPELESLKAVNRIINKLNLSDRVIRPGNLEKEDLIGFYNLATVYIQTSFYEGFGLPILEAMSCGTPVVCSNSGSLTEIGGDAAVYFNPLNLSQFVSIISDILQNKSLQVKLSDLGLKRVKEFSWEAFAQKTKEVYFKIIYK